MGDGEKERGKQGGEEVRKRAGKRGEGRVSGDTVFPL